MLRGGDNHNHLPTFGAGLTLDLDFIAQRFALSDAAKAHIALSARETVGASVLIP